MQVKEKCFKCNLYIEKRTNEDICKTCDYNEKSLIERANYKQMQDRLFKK